MGMRLHECGAKQEGDAAVWIAGLRNRGCQGCKVLSVIPEETLRFRALRSRVVASLPRGDNRRLQRDEKNPVCSLCDWQ